MHRLLVPTLFAALLTSPGLADTPKPTSAELRETLRQLELDLREARGLTAGITDKSLRQRMVDLLGRMEQRRELLEKQLAGTTAPAARRAIADAELDKFVKAMKGESFDDRRGALLRDFARNNHFTSAQAATLVKLFTFSAGQSEAAIALHPRLVDPGNFYQVLGVFTFEQDKDKVRKALGIK